MAIPGVAEDWKDSKHFDNNVTCLDCHEAQSTDADAVTHNGHTITMVVSPLDCANCHAQEVAENDRSLHALGSKYYELLYNKGVLPYLESQVDGEFITYDGEVWPHAATTQGCQACHGTNMTSMDDPYDPQVWPNNGIGRINPDGSMGSCTTCHTRHTFSVAEARSPEVCGQCHLGPDHPQIEIYMESKHGNIYSAEGDEWNWTADDWEAGIDYRAPTCASCHMSSAGSMPATHDVGERLSWELEPAMSKRTDNTANSLGTTIGNNLTWQEKQENMQTVCKQCHGSTWVEQFYTQADVTVELYNEQWTSANAVVTDLRDEGLIDSEPFNEEIEWVIYYFWHHEGRRARMGAFMAGPDYVQWHGFFELLEDRNEIDTIAAELRAHNDTTDPDSAGDGHDIQGAGDDDDDEDEDTVWYVIGFLTILLVVNLAVSLPGMKKD